MRLELSPFNVDVVIIEPGVIKTDFGNVTLEPMLACSSNSTYSAMAKKIEKMVKSYKQGSASSPTVIAKVVSQAIKAKKPKTRYVAGKLAKPLILMRKLLSDRLFDKIIMSAY